MTESINLLGYARLDNETLGALVRAARRGPVRIHLEPETPVEARLRRSVGGGACLRPLGYPDRDRHDHYVYELDLSARASAPLPGQPRAALGVECIDPAGRPPRRGRLCDGCPLRTQTPEAPDQESTREA